MDGAILRLLLPQVPSITKTALWHSIGQTPTSSYWDLRTAVTIQVLRNFMQSDDSSRRSSGGVLKLQRTTMKAGPIKGPIWIAKTAFPAPVDEALREVVFEAVEALRGPDAGELSFTRPELGEVEVEWTGFRSGVGAEEAQIEADEREKYTRLMGDESRTSKTTILYFHGGAYYLMDPATHRLTASKLAKESKGRVCNVRYRLAPQAAFPAQLLDGLMAYLSLLYPPAGAFHEPVAAEEVVFAGDSAGGNLAFALLQLLLQMRRSADGKTGSEPTIRFHGKDVAVPLPAGVMANSGWFDIGRCLPSLLDNAKFDYLPAPKDDAIRSIPTDSIWPTDPPRGDLFCDLTLVDHQLTSPLLAETWEGSPPLWLCTGTEMLYDEDAFVAKRAQEQGVTVRFEHYEAMPHCFGMILTHLETARRCMRSCGDFARRCVEEPETLKSEAKVIRAKTGKEESLGWKGLSPFTLEEVRQKAVETKIRRMQGWESGMKTKSSL